MSTNNLIINRTSDNWLNKTEEMMKIVNNLMPQPKTCTLRLLLEGYIILCDTRPTILIGRINF